MSTISLNHLRYGYQNTKLDTVVTTEAIHIKRVRRWVESGWSSNHACKYGKDVMCSTAQHAKVTHEVGFGWKDVMGMCGVNICSICEKG